MPQYRRGYADGPFGQIHYLDTQTGIPLLLFHQAHMSQRQFDSVYPRLAAAGIRAIGVDMPGFGMSDAPNFAPTIQDYSQVTPCVLDHLGISAACALGHHTGALVATEAAALFPERVLGLILNGPTPFSAEQREQGLNYVEAHDKAFEHRADGQHLVEAFNNRMTYANPDTQWPLATRYIAEKFLGLGPLWYGHNAVFRYDHADAISNVSHPTLILTNTGDDLYDLARKAHKIRPDFAYAEIDGGGIDIVDEKPAEWTEQVVQFISEFG